jgi:ribokinase
MIGKLGNDSFGTELRANLESTGVDTAAVDIEPTSSGIAQIITAENGENVIVVTPGANAHVSSRYVEKHLEVIRSAGVVLAQLEIPLETVEYLASVTRKWGIPLVLDPAPARPLPTSLLDCVEWLTPNESETCSLLGLKSRDVPEDRMEEVAEILLQRGSRNVLLKLGQRGCFLALADGRRVFLPAYAVRAIDSTAAGDAFNGAFASALLAGHDPVRGASWASAVAAISVTRRGAQPSMPTQTEVQAFLKEREGKEQPV